MTSSAGTFEQFLLWERASRDTLEVKRLYVDMAGDLVAGVMLSQIIYWHLPNRDGHAKLQVHREGKLWLAKGRADWWEECRLSPKQADRAMGILQARGLIEVRLFQFGSAPTKHVRILPESFVRAWREELARTSETINSDGLLDSVLPKQGKCISTKSQKRSPRSVEFLLPQGERTLNTETTSEITASSSAPAKPCFQDDVADALVEELVSHGVGRSVAKRFAREKPEVCRLQLEYLPYARFKTTKGAWLANAIRDEYGPPLGYEDAKARKALTKADEEKRLARNALQMHGRAISEARTVRLRAAYSRLELTGGEPLRAFCEYVDQERAKTGRFARHLSPARQAEVLAAFDLPDQRLALFEEWRTTYSGIPVQQDDIACCDARSPVNIG